MGIPIQFQADVDLADETFSAECFERTRPMLESMEQPKLLPFTADAVALASIVIGHAPRIREFRDDAARLPDFDVSCIDLLEDRAHALMYAQRMYGTTIQPDGNLQALTMEAVQTRDRLCVEVRSLCANGVLDSEILREYTGHNGYRPVASDVSLLATIFITNWDVLSGKTLRTLDELRRAEALANRIVRLFGRRSHSDPEVKRWMGLRQRAFTLLVHTYDEVRAVILYLRRHQRDGDEIAPSLFLGRTRRKRAPTHDEPGIQPPIPSPSSPTTSSPQ